MALMSKQKKQGKPQAATRTTVLTVRLGRVREARMAHFIASQLVEPDKTAVVLKALDEFFDKIGVPNPPPGYAGESD
jgi:hypothetical protein